MIGSGRKGATKSWGWGRGGRGSAPSLAQLGRRRPQFAEHQTMIAIVIGQVVLVQKRVGLLVARDPGQPQFLHQPVLMRAVRPLDSSLGLRRTGGDDLYAQLGA